MINWRNLFPEVILERGFDYYLDGKVDRLSRYKNSVSATVYGKSIYFVDIELSEKTKEVRRMKCSCPHAKDGFNCKHMAAVLYRMEEKGLFEQKKVSEKRVFPFAKTETELKKKYFFDVERVTSDFEISEKKYEKALQLIEQGIVRLDKVKEEFGSYYRYDEKALKVYGIFEGEIEKKKTSTYVFVCITQEYLEQIRCGVPGCFYDMSSGYYGYNKNVAPCVHSLAMLILADSYIKKYNPGDATDYSATLLLSNYRNSRLRLNGETNNQNDEHKKKDVSIEPRLEIDYQGNLSMSLKIERNKLYVVKDLNALIAAAEYGKEMKLGTKETLDFSTVAFDEFGQKVYEFVRAEMKTEFIRSSIATQENPYGLGRDEIKKTMPLYGRRLDTFYKLASEGTVKFNHNRYRGKKTGELALSDNAIKLKLTIQEEFDDFGDFNGINISGEIPFVSEGLERGYYFDGKCLNRVNMQEMKAFDMLSSAVDEGDLSATIGIKHLSEFYHRVLPQIREVAEVKIENEKEILKHINPKAEFVFYLDVEDKNALCNPLVCYDEERFQLSDLEQEKSFAGIRDIQSEREAEYAVKKYLPYYDNENDNFHCDFDGDLIYNLLDSGVDSLMNIGEVQVTDRFKQLSVAKIPKVSIGVRLESDLLKLEISSENLTDQELLDVINSYRQKRRYHRLKNGNFVSTNNESIEELSEMMDSMRISSSDFLKGNMQIPVYRAIYLDKMLEKNDALYTERDKNFKSLIKEFKTVNDSEYELPHSLKEIARNYQEFGFKWLRTIEACGFGGILADDMGLGKTLQLIALLLDAKADGRLKNALIVTPASLVYNWKEEFTKFAPELKVQTITGTKTEREQLLARYDKYDAIITSYDLLKRDIHNYEELEFAYEIVDEAQYIKTHNTAAAKAVKVINSKTRFALTGTPIENRLSELWSIFDFLMPGFLYSYDRFRKEIETPIAKRNDEIVMARLKRMVEPFILRRLKAEVLRDLPEKIEEIHYVSFDKKQQEIYDGQVVKMKQMIESESDEDFNKSKMKILAELTRIRQICCDPTLCLDKYKCESAKREACIELVQSAIEGEHKVLLFSQFTSMLEILEEELRTQEIPYYKITGATKKEDRVDFVNRFNEDDTPVFLISLKAGGTGLNLTGADIVIHYDPWWNLAAQNQATDRAHRIGQDKIVTVFKLIAKNSIEEKILALQEKKGALADEILSGQTGGLMTMSREDLMGLL